MNVQSNLKLKDIVFIGKGELNIFVLTIIYAGLKCLTLMKSWYVTVRSFQALLKQVDMKRPSVSLNDPILLQVSVVYL